MAKATVWDTLTCPALVEALLMDSAEKKDAKGVPMHGGHDTMPHLWRQPGTLGHRQGLGCPDLTLLNVQ